MSEDAVYINTKITRCDQCMHMDEKRFYTGDSFENVFDWFCKKADNKKIGQQEDNDYPKIPQWCPLREKR